MKELEKQPYPEGVPPQTYPPPSYPPISYPQTSYPATSYPSTTSQQQPPPAYPQGMPNEPPYPEGSCGQQPYQQPTTACGQHSTVIMTQPVGYVSTTQVMMGPPNFKALAWLTALFCFWPLGIAAIIKSNEVDQATSRGDIVAANAASRSSRILSMTSICLGIFCIAVLITFGFISYPSWYSTGYR